ncbi:probable phosphatase phospho2 [Halyomorpha halys]|uniref:probable phosphatase phospho2 n=1 Tax=Halyomorpha halys TaxID=286706 RepID=UPI0006D516A8|nr:probable phosphatase phospho2 [Halyomorpha halys]
MTRMRKFLGVFDFDHTIIQDNSDIVVRDLLSGSIISQQTKNLAETGRWTAYMRDIFGLLHKQEISEEVIRKAIVEIPPVPYFLLFLHKLKEMDCDTIIISDANTYFIDEWLKSNNVKICIDAIYTNPAEFINGKLDISEYHFQDWCSQSGINLCKGYVMEKHIEDQRKLGIEYGTVFYVGDGQNDLCPSLKLRENDLLFPRIGYPLLDLIKSSKEIKALVTPWATTNDIFTTLQAVKS